MRWTSILAIYLLFWAMSVFLVLPFGVRTHEEAGIDKIPGQADSAPAQFDLAKLAIRTTILSAILFGLFYANYVYGWVSPADIDFFTPPNAD
jgi:predicted secreted protein